MTGMVTSQHGITSGTGPGRWPGDAKKIHPTPRRYAFESQPPDEERPANILAILDGEGCLPISTTELLARLNTRHPGPELADLIAGEPPSPQRVGHPELLRLLNRLDRRREVEKITVPDMRCRYWRRTPGPERSAP